MDKNIVKIADLNVEVIRKAQKNMYLRVKNGRISVSCPRSFSDKKIEAFVLSHRRWIAERLTEDSLVAKDDFLSGKVSFWGRKMVLLLRHEPPYGVTRSGMSLIMNAPVSATVEERRALLYSFYRSEMRQTVSRMIEKWSRRLGVTATGIRIRNMKSRWGSCSMRTHMISLNLRLVTASPACLEYVIVHELCHLIHPDHSAAFWGEVAALLPDWRERDRATMRIGPLP